MQSKPVTTTTRRRVSALGVIAYLLFALLAVPVQAAGIGNPDTECAAFGFDFGIERWGYSSGWSLTDAGSKAADYTIVVSGTDLLATWTASPGVDGVLAKAGSVQSGGGTAALLGGTGGTITVANLPALGGHGLSHVTFCGNNPVAPPAAATASATACDNDGLSGPNTGSILVSITNIDADDVTVTIGGEDAEVGENPVQAGTHAVLVTNNLAGDAILLTQNVTVDDCTPAAGPTPASVTLGLGSCVFGTQSTTPLSTTISPAGGATIALTKVGTGVVNTFSGSGGSASLTPGNYTWSATAQPGFQLTGITSGTFTAISCDVAASVFTPPPVVITTAAPAPPQVLGTQITRGQPLPVTGPPIPMANFLALAIAAILLGFSLNAAGTRRSYIRYAPKHLARDGEWIWRLELPQTG